MAVKEKQEAITINLNDVLEKMVGGCKPSQIMAGMCGIPENGCTVRITANAEIQFIPEDNKKVKGVKK